jgi:RimJ/RimL family protein N-acetyltransferase
LPSLAALRVNSMAPARDYRIEETLRNGTRVVIRAVQPDDRERIAKAFGGLDRETVYTRFFGYKDALSAMDLSPIDTMDFVHDAMLIATIGAGADERVIGSARYVEHGTDDGRRAAEVAFTVEEDYQGQGLAGRLLAHLAAIARAAGIDQFAADVLPGNAPMLAVFARSGLPIRQRRDGGVVHVALMLSQQA